jgi:hypothetical protein
LDRTSNLTVSGLVRTWGGFNINTIWTFRTAAPISFTVPNFGGAISSTNGFFGTDLNGDGGTGTTPRGDVLPGINLGQFGRSVKSFKELNQIVTAFNSTYGGKLTPHGQALVKAGLFTEAQLVTLGAYIRPIPLVPESNPYPFHNLFTTDLRFSRPVRLGKVREGLEVEPFLEVFNLFNHSPVSTYGGLGTTYGSLNYNYGATGNRPVTDLTVTRGRLNSTRLMQVGFRVTW